LLGFGWLSLPIADDRIVCCKNGPQVLRSSQNIAKKWFGEGMVRWNDEFWLLNWKTNTGQVFVSPASSPPAACGF